MIENGEGPHNSCSIRRHDGLCGWGAWNADLGPRTIRASTPVHTQGCPSLVICGICVRLVQTWRCRLVIQYSVRVGLMEFLFAGHINQSRTCTIFPLTSFSNLFERTPFISISSAIASAPCVSDQFEDAKKRCLIVGGGLWP